MKITISGAHGNTASNGTWWVVKHGTAGTDFSLYGILNDSDPNYVSGETPPNSNGTNTTNTSTFTIAQMVGNPGFNSVANSSAQGNSAAGSADCWSNGQGG